MTLLLLEVRRKPRPLLLHDTYAQPATAHIRHPSAHKGNEKASETKGWRLQAHLGGRYRARGCTLNPVDEARDISHRLTPRAW